MEILREIRKKMTSAGIDEREARAIALLLMEKVAGLDTAAALMADADKPLAGKDGSDVRERLSECAAKVASGIPVQHVLGEADFMGRTFAVDSNVLIPRPETAELVEWALQLYRMRWGSGKRRIVDIGTGSGCIALSIAAEEPAAKVEAWDVSGAALDVASRNAEALGVEVKMRQVDILEEKVECGYSEPFSMIVSNPPYICQSEAADMEAQVLDHEPHLALFVSDHDPLLFYREIATKGLKLLASDGILLFEINRRFGQETVELLRSLGYKDVELRQDMFGNDRMVKGERGE